MDLPEAQTEALCPIMRRTLPVQHRHRGLHLAATAPTRQWPRVEDRSSVMVIPWPQAQVQRPYPVRLQFDQPRRHAPPHEGLYRLHHLVRRAVEVSTQALLQPQRPDLLRLLWADRAVFSDAAADCRRSPVRPRQRARRELQSAIPAADRLREGLALAQQERPATVEHHEQAVPQDPAPELPEVTVVAQDRIGLAPVTAAQEAGDPPVELRVVTARAAARRVAVTVASTLGYNTANQVA